MDNTKSLSSIGKNEVCDLCLHNDVCIKLNTHNNSRHSSGYISNWLKTFTAFIIAFGIDKPQKFLFLVFQQIKIQRIHHIPRSCQISCVRQSKTRCMQTLNMVLLNGSHCGVCNVVSLWTLLFVPL